MRCIISIVLALNFMCFFRSATALLPSDPSPSNKGFDEISRRDLLVWPIGIGGAVVYGKLVSNAAQKLSRGELVYPEAHEQRVASTIATAMLNSIPSSDGKANKMDRPLRILEVGIGKDGRVIRRNLYRKAYDDITSSERVSRLDLTSVDIAVPPTSTLDRCKEILLKMDQEYQCRQSFILCKEAYHSH